ncbi:MAG: sigma 54-interacting transcriptional regulator [Firmicutes bacterium]|nr:sigma 54-interacting transcriptional regulator [Bacillota bacterium]
MDWTNYAEQVLNLYNYYAGAIMVNRSGIIEYYYNGRIDINSLTEKEVIGKSLFEVYPSVTQENSNILEVIRTGESKNNIYREEVNYKGERYSALCDTVPIFDEDKIIGAIEVFLYLEERNKYMNIYLSEEERGIREKQWMLEDIISASESMRLLKERIIKVSSTKSTVMIYGETGTGKELVAKAIHSNGTRKQKRFFSQNCAAIPENLLESLLFGTVRGSFTGAENRKGLFEVASGGTLFLDEINSMDLAVQSKILKVIEEQRIMRIGGTEEIPVDVRIIAATNEDPLACVEKGTLREDLYYRLKVVYLKIPPLRSRKEDIKPLVDYYIDFFNRTMGRNVKGVEPKVLTKFQRHSWPGNVRELRNTIEGAFNLCEGDYLGLDDFDAYALKQTSRSLDETASLEEETAVMEIGGVSLKEAVRRFEYGLVTRVISESDNLTRAAEKLGITRQTLNNKMKELKILERDTTSRGV